MEADLIRNGDSQLGKFVALLESVGYEQIEATEPTEIGHFEYALRVIGGKKMVVLGTRRAGDEGAT